MSQRKKAQAQGGFTLIEILLVISILMGIGLLEMRRDAANAKEQVGQAVGSQIAVVGKAVDSFMAARVSKLQTMTDPVCISTGDYCELSLDSLVSLGYLPATFTNSVKFGGGYIIRVRRVAPPTPPNAAAVCANANPIPRGCPSPYPSGSIPTWQWGLQSMTITSEPWLFGGTTVDWGGLGIAVRQAGANAGTSQSGSVAGLAGGWSFTTEFGPGVANGQLAYVSGAQVSLWSQFLSRDANRPMTGNLDLGSYNIVNMRDMYLNGPASNPRNKNLSSLLPNWVFKGVYAAKDGDFVPSPVCDGGGAPKIKVLMQLMQGTKSSFYYDNGTMRSISCPDNNTACQAAAQADLAANASKHQLNNWADVAPGGWIVHFEDKFNQHDSSGNSVSVKGEGLAELYCNYPDQ